LFFVHGEEHQKPAIKESPVVEEVGEKEKEKGSKRWSETRQKRKEKKKEKRNIRGFFDF
jgi:hypothetical protein